METPTSASWPVPDELPFSPAAERNAAPIHAVLRDWLPPDAEVLEVASGTGQHAQHLAAAEPAWQWHPSEASSEALLVIAARCAGLPNVRAALQLDVQVRPWPAAPAAFDAVFAANLLHIAPSAATPALMQGAVQALKPGGSLMVYGPFFVQGEPIAPSNIDFDADLRQRDPSWGLRWLHEVQAAAHDAGLALVERRSMPANNLMVWFSVAR
jgi:SAM-dependent methyltransferase